MAQFGDTNIMIAFFLLHACEIDNTLDKIADTDVPSTLLEVDPLVLSFGSVAPGSDKSEVVTLTNLGSAAIDITNISLEGSAFTAASSAPLGLLEPGNSTEMWITYAPLNLQDQGWLRINTDSAAQAETLVQLVGEGLYPLLTINPPELDMGWSDPGERIEDGFTLRNDGAAALTISQTLVVGNEFELLAPQTSGITLAPGEEVFMDIAYSPTEIGIHSGVFYVESDTPAGTQQAPITAASSEQPVAVCEVTPTEIAPHYERADWIGEESYDPGGAALTEYDWSLVQRPSGSAMNIGGGAGANRLNFSPDLAGTYVGQLIVYNEYGRPSEPCTAELEAIPRESLWVEMFWQYPGDDMDLHILKPGGAMETDGDCFYMNCVNGGWLDWGIPGYGDDDPSLDIDDIPGVGPENTNIMDPENGQFQVWVHDFPGSVYSSANEVTVKIYVTGDLVWEDTRTISGENSYTHYATVIWPDGVVVPQ